MGRYLSIIIVLCAFFLLGMIKTANSMEFERKEALQMYAIEGAYQAIKKSEETRKNFPKKNDRTLASQDTNQEEFEKLMASDDKEEWFDDIDKIKN